MKCTMPSNPRARPGIGRAEQHGRMAVVAAAMIFPGLRLANPADSSAMGNASMSARKPRCAPVPWRSMPTTPVPPGRRCTSSPRSAGAATRAEVRRSSKASSGLACRSRHSTTRSEAGLDRVQAMCCCAIVELRLKVIPPQHRSRPAVRVAVVRLRFGAWCMLAQSGEVTRPVAAAISVRHDAYAPR